jgi:hypothetical protein
MRSRAERIDQLIGKRVAGAGQKPLEPGAPKVAPLRQSLSEQLDRREVGREIASLVALDGFARYAQLVAKLGFDAGRSLALRRAEGKLTVDATAAVVRRVFTLRPLFSLNSIAAKLNTEGVPTPHGRKVWYASTVRQILLNEPMYRGERLAQLELCDLVIGEAAPEATAGCQDEVLVAGDPLLRRLILGGGEDAAAVRAVGRAQDGPLPPRR